MRSFIIAILLLAYMPFAVAPGQHQGISTIKGEDITPEEEDDIEGILQREIC